MKRYTGKDLQALYDEVPQELYDRVNHSLAKIPEETRQRPLINRKLSICLITVIVMLIGLIIGTNDICCFHQVGCFVFFSSALVCNSCIRS